MDMKPTLWNGPTVNGRFGRPDLRHPYEMILLFAVIVLGATAIMFYGWSTTVTAEACQSAVGLVGILLSFGTIDGWCSGEVQTGPAAFASVVSIMIGIGIALVVVRAILYAQLRATSVRMSPTQFPEGYRMVVEASARFGLRRVPDAYVVLGNGTVNAFASGHGHRRFVAVYSDLFEVGGSARDPRALQFVISHEVGHIAAGHTSYFRLLASAIGYNIPLLGQALSRAQEYTADNYGYDAVPAGAPGVIGLLGAGKYLGGHVNFHAVADRAATEASFWVNFVNWISTHPVLTWRAQALRDRRTPGRLMFAPKQRDGAVWAQQILPAGQHSSAVWPTPQQVLALMDVVKPVARGEQFGRFPGVTYADSVEDYQLANPAPVPPPTEAQAAAARAQAEAQAGSQTATGMSGAGLSGAGSQPAGGPQTAPQPHGAQPSGAQQAGTQAHGVEPQQSTGAAPTGAGPSGVQQPIAPDWQPRAGMQATPGVFPNAGSQPTLPYPPQNPMAEDAGSDENDPTNPAR